MKVFLFSLSAFLALTSAIADSGKSNLRCQAVFRTLDEQDNTVERTSVMVARSLKGEQQRYELEFEGRFFGLTEDLANGDLFAQIASSPDYTKGSVFRGSSDSLGRFTATEVVGFTVYRLECQRNR